MAETPAFTGLYPTYAATIASTSGTRSTTPLWKRPCQRQPSWPRVSLYQVLMRSFTVFTYCERLYILRHCRDFSSSTVAPRPRLRSSDHSLSILLALAAP